MYECCYETFGIKGLAPDELDFILVATITPDFNTPAVACQVQGNIGAHQAFAFDISAACAGFVYALSLAEKLIRTGSKKGSSLAVKCCQRSWIGKIVQPQFYLETGQAGCF